MSADQSPLPHDGWRYRVIAEWHGIAVRVDSFKTKRQAKDLRNRLRTQFAGTQARFRLGWSVPRPRWRQMKAALRDELAARQGRGGDG